MNTIAAISTPCGTGGIGVIRVSGQDAIDITQKVFKTADGSSLSNVPGYTAKLGKIFYEGQAIDEVIALVFRSPKSYTGENMVEISCHGGMFITKSVLRSLLSAGAYLAGPGEFTKRAFLNGKISLDKAESIMGLISASYEKARSVSFSAYCGSLREKIAKIKNKLIDLLSDLNAEIDYSEEDIPEIDNKEIFFKINEIKTEIKKVSKSYSVGYIIKNGLKTAILGAPNVGKSTLMNLLSNREKSIVTDIAGTTRDAIEENIILGDVPITLVDTAGIRDTDDVIEKIGTERSLEIAKTSDLILIMLDASRDISPQEISLINSFDKSKVILIVNKIDLNSKFKCDKLKFNNIVFISAKNKKGIDDLSKRISDFVDFRSFEDESIIITTERQRDVLVKSLGKLQNAEEKIKIVTRDVLTEMIKESLQVLSEFTGENVESEIIDSVFSKFCVGK